MFRFLSRFFRRSCCSRPNFYARGWFRHCLSCGASYELRRGRWFRC